MKKISLTLFALLTAGFCVGQNTVPTAAKSDLAQRFANSTNARWEQEGNHFEAEWKENGREVAVLYSKEGNYLMTEREISTGDLPNLVTDAISKEMKGATMLEAERQEKADGSIGYQVELKHQGKVKEVTFDDKGNALGEELEGSGGSEGSDGSDEN